MDFEGFTYKEFLLWLMKLTNGACDNVYYCIRKESLCEGIRRIDSDADYWEFVETVYSLESDSLESELDVYIDHRNEPILDWADNEFLAGGKGYESDELDEEDDKDSEVSMTMEYEHEWDDEEEHTFDKTVGDPFLDKLSGHVSDDDEEEAKNGKLKDVVFPIHNENQEWEQMVLVLGMKFSNPLELKLCITNYAVKNGYDLWYEKSDHERNARKYAFQEIEGTLKEHYAKTWSYGEEIRRTNPGSTVKMDVDVMPDGTTYFSKFYVTLAHEVDIDSDNEVEIEPESDVDSFDLEFENDVQPEVEDGVELEVQDRVQHKVQDEVQVEVEPEIHPEVHDDNQIEVHPAVQAEVEPEVQSSS
ncbi:unnamed protein product [Lactuca saligna]|uniref:Transposase MuDR plant domain-containing protein n=1 Tax=Lactuca saligna TaxID=75948 RepID=A0AA35Z1Q4_LACSI|nr:unnamed protein product [Lactuca saligna]